MIISIYFTEPLEKIYKIDDIVFVSSIPGPGSANFDLVETRREMTKQY